mgnify:CR=1 FL=1
MEFINTLLLGLTFLKNAILVEKYASKNSFEKNDERIYLCADYIEKELHKLMYGDFIFEKQW